MKKSLFYISLLSVLFLVGCTPKDEISIDGQAQQQEEAKVNDAQVQQSEAMKSLKTTVEKYGNPKRATLRNSDSKALGKVYMQYDKAEDKTYFWTELSDYPKPEDNSNLSVWLINKKEQDTAKQQVNVGSLMFAEDGSAYLYYEFSNSGNMYDYLKVVITKDGATPDSDNEVLKAYFNPKLS